MDHIRRGVPTLVMVAALVSWLQPLAAQGEDRETLKERLLARLNEERDMNGLPALRRVEKLDDAAQSYSEVMMRATAGGPVYLSHTGPDGSTLGSRVSDTGYLWFSLGENLAAGQQTPEQVVEEWLSSALHAGNILDPSYRDIGLGLASGPGTWPSGRWDPQVLWWSAVFGEGPDPEPDDTGAAPGRGPAPSVSGYTSLDGAPVTGAAFGTLLMIQGQNLGLSGSIAFHGRPTSAVLWSPTSIMAFVPLQPSYPDVGPVEVTVAGRNAAGPLFTTVRPGALPPVSPTPSAPNPSPVPGDQPTITSLVNGLQQRVTTVGQGSLFSIRGRNFGTNESRRGSVVFVTPAGARLDGAVWDWADDTIVVFAPYFRGRVEVAVQVDVRGTLVNSNRAPLTVQ